MNEVPAVKEFQVPPSGSSDVERFINNAIASDIALDKMQLFLQMRDQLRAENARIAYDVAMADFQSECPVISKDKKVFDKNGKVRYSYAPLDNIVSQIKKILAKHGFRYMVTSEIDDKGWVVATTKVFHIGGHTESSTFKVPIDKDAFMNEQQKVAAALTYAKRYSFTNAFGILTGDEDTDAITPDKTEMPEHAERPPAETPPTDMTRLENNTISGLVDEITQKANKTGGGSKYNITINSDKFGTFDKTFAEIAKKAKEEKKIVTVKYTKNQWGKEIILLSTGLVK